MKCEKCGYSFRIRPLMRVNEKGKIGIWWCRKCVETHEPELWKNELEDQSEIEKLIFDIFDK